MAHNIADTHIAGVSKYEDLNKKVIKHSVPMFNAEERRELEEKIVEELYRIFTHKVK